MEWRISDYLLTDARSAVDLDAVFELLRGTYWGHRRSRDIIPGLVEASLCFSLFCDQRQIGFARVVSDYEVISWIADMVIQTEHRGKGLGTWMFSRIIEFPGIRRTQMVLQTGDAHRFYEKFNFKQNSALMTRSPELP